MTYLFQYKKINDYFWQQLITSKLYCAKREELNDPFDCYIDWSSIIDRILKENEIENLRRQNIVEIRQGLLNWDPTINSRVGCFTNNCDTPLMWSHYADSHTGVCLAYADFTKNLNLQYPNFSSEKAFFWGASRVEYGDNAFSTWLLEGDLNAHHSVSAVGNAIIKLFTIKSTPWAYEEEYRFLMHKEERIKLDETYLRQVTFGMHIDSKNEEAIREVIRNKYSKVIFSRVVKSSQNDMGIEIIEC